MSLKERIKLLDLQEQNFLHNRLKTVPQANLAMTARDYCKDKSFNNPHRYETTGNLSTDKKVELN